MPDAKAAKVAQKPQKRKIKKKGLNGHKRKIFFASFAQLLRFLRPVFVLNSFLCID
jgi:hypothetical protein